MTKQPTEKEETPHKLSFYKDEIMIMANILNNFMLKLQWIEEKLLKKF